MINMKQQQAEQLVETSRTSTAIQRVVTSSQQSNFMAHDNDPVDLIVTPSDHHRRQQQQQQDKITRPQSSNELIDGSDPVTTIGCVGAQTGSSRLVICMLKEGKQFQLKVQEMRPAMLEIGANSRENKFMVREQESFVQNLRKQERGPLDAWMDKFKNKWSHEEKMYFSNTNNYDRQLSNKMNATLGNANNNTDLKAKRRLTYMCMGENVATCWRALLNQLDRRSELLAAGSRFYGVADELIRSLDMSEKHVQESRYVLLGDNNNKSQPNLDDNFKRVLKQIELNNEAILKHYNLARKNQAELILIIEQIGRDRCGDSRQSLQISDDARALIAYIRGYLDVLQKRKLQMESMLTSLYQEISLRNKQTTKTITTTTTTINQSQDPNLKTNGQDKENVRKIIQRPKAQQQHQQQQVLQKQANNEISSRINTSDTNSNTNIKRLQQSTTIGESNINQHNESTLKPLTIREVNSLNDLISIEQWLNIKLGQLNSSLLSSLGSNVGDSRCILTKHEQIMLECRCIDEAASKFQGRSIHGIRANNSNSDSSDDSKLIERQRALLSRVREVISILEVRVVLLRRTIDFYLRSRDATGDIIKMMRRLQVDNSLQSVHFVTNELELRDVSSVIASGATILSELQQLQLAQQQGQRSSCVHLNMETSGVRALIDELNHELAHLKSVLNQRRLVLQNEDSEKMAASFINKCQQLHLWLEQQLNTFLLNNARLGSDMNQVAQFCLEHERMRATLQQKASEVDALLRSMASLSNQDSKFLSQQPNNANSNTASTNKELQRNQSVQEAADELRRDWIEASNCLARRIDLAKRYAAIMQLASIISNELDSLDKFCGRPQSRLSNSSTQDQRGEEELRLSVNQRLVQLGAEVKLVAEVARPESIQISSVNIMQQNNGRPQSQLNHEQVSDHANAILSRLLRARREVEQRIENSRKKPAQTNLLQTSRIKKQQQLPATSQLQQEKEHNVTQLPAPVAPKFIRALQDKALEPFARVELECELDQSGCRVEWFLNNHKRIPASIRHSMESDKQGKVHKLIINNFSPIACGTYTAKAINPTSGLLSSSQCKLTLVGIKEHPRSQKSTTSSVSPREDPRTGTRNVTNQQQNVNTTTTNTTTMNQTSTQQQIASPSAISTTSSFSQWHPTSANGNINNNNNYTQRAPIERIIRGVNEIARDQKVSPSSDTPVAHVQHEQRQQQQHQRQQVFSSQSNSTARMNTSPTIIINRQHYKGPTMVELNHIDSPSMDSTTSSLASRSISKSPSMQAKQQQLMKAPEFVQELRADSSLSNRSSQSRAELVCVVVGNPPPLIEWLHNDQLIASARCTRSGNSPIHTQQPHNNICKLSIETRNPDTSGQYICRARNRYGQSSTGYLITR